MMTLPYENPIRVIDDFLSNSDHRAIYDELMRHNFTWNRSIVVDQPKQISELENLQFTHMMYIEHMARSNSIELLNPILQQLNLLCIYRIKANLNPYRNGPIIEHGMHTDWPPEIKHTLPIKTAIYYVNDNNGYTIFENGEKVQSRANRIAIFDGNIKHSGSTCNDQPYRVVININYIECAPLFS